MAAGNVAPIAVCMNAFDRPPIHLGQENMGDGFDNTSGGTLQQVREANTVYSSPEPDRIVHAGERIKFNAEFRHQRTWAQDTIGLLENLLEIGPQDSIKLSRPPGSDLEGLGDC